MSTDNDYSDREEFLPNHSDKIRETLDVLLDSKPASAALLLTVDTQGYLNYASWGVEADHAKELLQQASQSLSIKEDDDGVRPKYLN